MLLTNIPCGGNPDGCHGIYELIYTMGLIPSTCKPFVAADGLLSFYLFDYIFNNRINKFHYLNNRYNNIKSIYVYRPPFEKIFPARAIHTPPFRSRGMTGNRLFNRTPSTKLAKLNYGRWVPPILYTQNQEKSTLVVKCQIKER